MAELISMLAAAGGAGGEVDPNFNQTVLLLHGDGSDGAQNNTFQDSSSNNFTITRNPATGPNAPTQGSFSPFSAPDGRWSIFCDGNNQYLTAADSTDFEPGTGDFQINFWVYHTSAAGSLNVYIAHTTNGISLYRKTDGKFAIAQDAVAELAATTNAVPVNQWVYLTALRSSGTIKLYIDAVEEASLPSNTTNFAGSGSIGIGASSNGSNDFVGYISNLQIIKGGSTTPTSVPTSPLTTSVSSGTVSFLSCQSNRFVDNETTPVTLTANGGVKVIPFSPFAPTAAYSASVNGGSGYFDGTGDYLTAASDAAFALGTGDFCIEGWYFVYTNKDYNIYFDFRNGTGTAVVPYFYSTSTGDVDYFVNNGSRITGSGAIKAGQWSHIAVIRSGTDTKLFINGAQIGSTYTDSNNYVQGPLYIGRNNGGGTTYDASYYCAGFRVVKGTTGGYGTPGSTITVPTAPKVSDANTSVLLNFINAGIFDNTGKNNLETVGNAQIDTTTKKFGTGSMEFDGTGDYLVGPNQPWMNFGTGDFTIECWVYFNSVGATQMFVSSNYNSATGAGGWTFGYRQDNTTLIFSANANQQYGKTWSPSTGTWYHVAVSRSGTDLRLFVDGTQLSTTSTSSDNIAGATTLVVAGNLGGSINFVLNGFIDDLRITKGVARYTSNFTAPTKAFPDL